MSNTSTFRLWLGTVGLLLILRAPFAQAEEMYCQTPPLTKVLQLEMQSYKKQLEERLQKAGCISTFSLFGLSFTGIDEQEAQKADAFWNAHVDDFAGYKTSLQTLTDNALPAQLREDEAQLRNALLELHTLVSKTEGSCSTALMVSELGGEEVRTMRLADSAEGRFMAYKSLYALLVNADKHTVPFTVKDLSPDAERVYNFVLGKYVDHTLGTNPFFQIADYRRDVFSSCQSKELGLDRINASITALEETFKKTQSQAMEVGSEVNKLALDVQGSMLEMQKYLSTVATAVNSTSTSSEKAAAIAELGKGLRSLVHVSFQSPGQLIIELGVIPGKLRSNGAPLKEFSFEDVQNAIVDVDIQTGRITRKSMSEVLTDYQGKKIKALTSKADAIDDFMKKSYDTLGLYTSYQLFSEKLTRLNTDMDNINTTMEFARENFSHACSNHLPNAQDDCGEKKN